MLPERHQQPFVRYTATAGTVALCFLVRTGVQETTGPYGFILFIPAIVAASVLFDRGSGFVAVALSMVSVGLIIPWQKNFPRYLTGMIVFGFISTLLVLRTALERAVKAERDKALLRRAVL